MNQEQNNTERVYDILVFGATGFTGKFVLEELISLQAKEGDPAILGDKKNFRIGIAGRNKTKLDDLVSSLLKKYPSFNDTIDCLEADVTDLEKVSQATQKAKVVISCVGPYRLYGEPIVEACVLTGTHYVDITGEPRFVEDMFCKYNEEARRKDIMIVHYCGFDSVPADMGSLLVKKELSSKGFRPLSIETFATFSSTSPENVINYATYQSAVLTFISNQPQRKDYKSKLVKPTTYGPEITFSNFPRTKKNIEGYYSTFPAADPLVIKMGQQIYETYPEDRERFYGNGFDKDPLPSVKVGSFITYKEFKTSLFTLMGGLAISFLGKYSWGKSFLLNYPHYITFGLVQPPNSGGPSLETIESGSFAVKILGKGIKSETFPDNTEENSSIVPDTEMTAVFSGPDAGYRFTSKSVVMASLTILKEKVTDQRSLPRGILTPSVAFGNSSFLDRLKSSDEAIKFEFS